MAEPARPRRAHPFTRHDRKWCDFHYVYPVISRRSEGLSIGINLNVDKLCNFDCPYCQVDRTVAPDRRDVDLQQLGAELAWMVDDAVGGALWSDPMFADVPPSLRRINDIAFSGDGEPTLYPQFDHACRIAADIKAAAGLDAVKLAVLTNATLLDRPHVQRGLAILEQNQGEVWAKLDAGSSDYYRLIDRSSVPLKKVLANIAAVGRQQPIVIQSMFARLHGQLIPDDAFNAYLDRLADLLADGCRIRLVQLYTVARRPAEPFVQPLSDEQLDALAQRLKQRLPELACEVYYGVA